MKNKYKRIWKLRREDGNHMETEEKNMKTLAWWKKNI